MARLSGGGDRWRRCPTRWPSKRRGSAARLIADDLAELGITVDARRCSTCRRRGADPVIGDRAWGTDPARVARLGRAVCDGLLAGGVLPIIKHIPGHGRARVDSHTRAAAGR